MERFLGLDSPIMRALSMVADLVILNLLWLICCIPVVTIGASTTAMYTVALKLAKGQDGYVFKRFMKAFKLNFKQATIIHLIVCAFAAILGLDYYIYKNGGLIPKPMLILITAVGIAGIIFASWVYPILAQFDNSIKNTIKNAFAMAIVHFPVTIVIVVLNLVSPAIFLFFTGFFVRWMILWILAGGSAIAYLNAFALNMCFKRYIPKEILEKEKEDAVDFDVN
ncbi:MAG: YesL family protein [Lachnospiraceae bacterium]|nr:YesL family protein [Lachnospiraceae bacterium]